jgi:hypothetical protein
MTIAQAVENTKRRSFDYAQVDPRMAIHHSGAAERQDNWSRHSGIGTASSAIGACSTIALYDYGRMPSGPLTFPLFATTMMKIVRS